MSGWGGNPIWEDTSAMKAALPETDHPEDTAQQTTVEATTNGDSNDGDAATNPKAAWGEKTAYNYNETNIDREWEVNNKVYEWDGEEGDVGPEHPELEVILFGRPEERGGAGIDFSKIIKIDVTQEGLKRIDPISSFKHAGLHPVMAKNVEMCGFETPTPIQRYCIPAIKLGYDLIAVAQTGSGKTCAYLVPILNHLMGKAKKLAAPRRPAHEYETGVAPYTRAEPLVVVVVPARELAIQIFNEARKLCYRSMLRPAVVYGGAPMRDQMIQLGKGCDILIATPGRLIDMMERPHILSFRRVKYMVIDEADEMLHSDWEEEFTTILTGGEQEEGNIKYMLFSATFPAPVRQLAKTHLAPSHVRIHVGRVGSTTDNIKQDIIYVDSGLKCQALHDLLYAVEPGRTIIFVNGKRTADELDDFLFNKGLPVTSMHADRTQREREDSMRAFRSGKMPILITTGVTARGIDVRNVKHVINFDLPSMEHGGIEEYTHRIGRTGRIGHHGTATSFYNERDESIARVLTLTLLENKQDIPDFLQEYVPDDIENLNFEDNSEEEEEDVADGNNAVDAWGAPATTGATPAASAETSAAGAEANGASWNAGGGDSTSDGAKANDAWGAW